MVIAVVAATAALWAALTVAARARATLASLVMGLAVSSMHYTGMAAVGVELTPPGGVLPGATAMQFIFPLAVLLGSFLFLASAFVALSPTRGRGPRGRRAPPRLAPLDDTSAPARLSPAATWPHRTTDPRPSPNALTPDSSRN